MNFYIGLFVATFICAFADFFNLAKRYKICINIFLSIIYILLSGLRWNGLDWKVYYSFFTLNNTLNNFLYGEMAVDKGFGVLNFLIKTAVDDYSVLLFVVAIITISIKVEFINKFAVFPLFSMLYWFSTNIGEIFFIRQFLAVSITLIAFRFIVKKQFIPFCFFVYLAATIQISTIFFLPAYFLFYKKIKVKFIFLGLVVSIILGKILDPTILPSLSGVINVLPIDVDRINNKIDLYSDYGMADREEGTLLLGYLRRLLFLPLELWAINKMDKFNINYRGFVNIISFGYILYFALSGLG